MPSAAARRLYEDQIPSFMTVFDLDAETIADRETVTVLEPKYLDMDAGKPAAAPLLRAATMPSDPMHHKHHDSTSTQASESAESSPTTTLSTTDSSPLSDPSPSSSPDSPINLVPLSSFPATSFGSLAVGGLTLTLPEQSTLAPTGRPMTSPAPRRPKNMKGLSIQPPSLSNGRPTTATSIMSEPASPVFIKPTIPAMKRKPSQLSLKTNSSDLLLRPTTLEVPSTPALAPMLQRRALKHSTSSPHMLSGLQSATHGPAGGMCFPKVHERNQSGLSELLRPTKLTVGPDPYNPPITEEDSPIRTQMANDARMEGVLCDESEQNEDQKSPGYPDGPVAIYDDNVFLYLEPSAEEAARFDTVINVAREVRNPFSGLPPTFGGSAPVSRKPSTDSAIPNTAATNASFATAFEVQPPTPSDRATDTPTTPKAITFPPKQPEYIHMPWDHSTDIAPDLMRLCEIIQSRTREGKKVLIHCQQGASRSASLIIAYGLFCNPELSVNDAYYAAQSKSRWISPNMKLMYCLQDFQKDVCKKKATPGSAYRPRTGRSPTKHRLTLSADAIEISPKEPRTAPLPNEMDDPRRSPGGSSRDSPARLRGYSTPGSNAVSPGPSSAPSTFSFSSDQPEGTSPKPAHFNLDRLMPMPTQQQQLQVPQLRTPPPSQSVPSPQTEFTFKPPPSPGFGAHRFGPSTVGGFGFASLNLGQSQSPELQAQPPSRPHGFDFGFSAPPPALPVAMDTDSSEPKINIISSFPDDEALMSPRAETMTSNPLHEPFQEVAGMHFAEAPPTPTAGLFSPRDAMFPREPFFSFGRPSAVADPRSPPTKGEAPIVRSIDDML
ncbi:tyrosine-protein phosphatase pmp1 [Plectosphaerella plurivora]|uniref:protein-tyrosine-phosphatase n=1 Tax=Plectosphaerella plurivora TaxID=936078 RepID=A0A9P9ABS8_9PEZI|nr:tyrosine-protein phosphatase pmp1 [Plectosphaerella plurivora]